MRILVIKLSSLGDLFHVLPAVHCIKVGMNASVDWVTQSSYVELVKCFTDVECVIPFYRDAFFRKLPTFLRDVRNSDYDIVADFQGLWKSAIAARFAKSKQRIGPSFHREGSRLLYTAVAGGRDMNRHAVDQAMDTARHLNVPLLDPSFPVSFPNQAVDAPRPRVALAPFSRWPSKNWPAGFYTDLGRDLREQTNASIFVIGGREEETQCSSMARTLAATNMAGKLTLPELGGFLREMDLVVANDSGPLHMAAAVGTRTLALFGPTDPALTGPYGAEHRVLQTPLRCRPCHSMTCRFGAPSCLAVLTPETASNAAMQMLAKSAGTM